jgi:iron complex transport system permease protein
MLLMLASLSVGRYPLAPEQVYALIRSALGGPPHALEAATAAVFWELRIPRTMAALLVGAALASAGVALQRVFRNPLAAPELLGISTGAALAAALAMALDSGVIGLRLSAFVGGLAAAGLVFAIGPILPLRDRMLGLVLTGVAVSSFLGALLVLVMVMSDPQRGLPAITFWMLGSFEAIAQSDLIWLALGCIVGIGPLWLLRWRADALALGDDEARSLGLSPMRLRLALVAAAALLTALSVAAAGIIGWVALVVPQAARLLAGAALGRLLPVAALVGAGFMLMVDTLGRLIPDLNLPPGAVAALVGAPVLFAIMLRRHG